METERVVCEKASRSRTHPVVILNIASGILLPIPLRRHPELVTESSSAQVSGSRREPER